MNAKTNAGAALAKRREAKAAKAPSPKPAPKAGKAAAKGEAALAAKAEAARKRAEAKAEREARAASPAPAPKAPKADRPLSARAQREADAQAGIMPSPPDFSAPTHKPYRARLAALVALVEAGDIAGLRDIEMIPPRSSSPKALHRYRDLALMALAARHAAQRKGAA